LNPGIYCRRFWKQETSTPENRSAAMPKRVVGTPSSALQESETSQFVSIALFSGVGLLISLVIVLCRMHGIF
jgi:hypothetical protein